MDITKILLASTQVRGVIGGHAKCLALIFRSVPIQGYAIYGSC
jgi:hypothetical protein